MDITPLIMLGTLLLANVLPSPNPRKRKIRVGRTTVNITPRKFRDPLNQRVFLESTARLRQPAHITLPGKEV
jgi:hypothetical protein